MADLPPMYARQRPWVRTVDKNTPFPICTCGMTASAPQCDGSGPPDGACQPREHLSKRKEQLFICGCGRSGNPPFCDGSHNKNDGKSAGQLIREFIRNPRDV